MHTMRNDTGQPRTVMDVSLEWLTLINLEVSTVSLRLFL